VPRNPGDDRPEPRDPADADPAQLAHDTSSGRARGDHRRLRNFIVAVGILLAFGDNDPSCSPDLIQTFGNGATWGTLIGLGVSLPTMVRSIFTDFLEAKSGNGKIEMIRTLAIGFVLAALTAFIYTHSLLHGSGWPK
jgi:hypothetical protein